MVVSDESNDGPATVTRADIVEAVYVRIGLPRSECAVLVESVIGAICNAAASGENVKLSSFGSFIIRQKQLRMGRNPKTGEEVPIAPRRVMTFKPSNLLRARVNGEAAGSTKTERE